MPHSADSARPASPDAPALAGLEVPASTDASAFLPATFWRAALRGMRGCCPRCGKARLFARWIKPVDACPACGQDWSHQRADDFPAYIAILLTGHILAPVIIALVRDFDLSPGVLAAILLPLATAMMLAMLQPAKGAVIAAQWWHGLNGFRRERRAEDEFPR